MKTKMRYVMLGAILANLMIMNIGFADLSEGLEAHWSFNDEMNPGYDDTNHGHNGIVVGDPESKPGMVGNALSFDGEDDYVQAESDAANILPSGSSCTVSLWINMAWIPEPSPWPRIIGCERQNDGFILEAYGIGSKLQMGAGNGSWTIIPLLTIEVDRWYHVAMTFESSETRWEGFVDGQPLATMTQDWSWWFGPRQLIIGGDDDDTGVGAHCFTQGIIDEVRIYSRALKPSEIQQLAEIDDDDDQGGDDDDDQGDDDD